MGPEEIDIGTRTQEKKLPFWWIGTTYFCEVGVEDEDENDEWQPAMVRGLVRFGGPCGRGILDKDLSAHGIDRQL